MRLALLAAATTTFAVIQCRPGDDEAVEADPEVLPRPADRVDHDLTTGRLKAPEEPQVPERLQDPRDSPWVERYERWDLDDDFVVTTEEWRAALEEVPWFTDWDADADETLTTEELGTGLSTTWDIDGDEVVDRWEYLQGTRMFYRTPREHGRFEELDTDDSGTLTPAELGPATASSFSAWDADHSGRITAREWSDALFRAWDVDADGRIEVHEARVP